MRKASKWLSLLLACTLAVTLAACGTGGADTGAADTAESAGATSADSGDSAAATGEKVTIHYQTWNPNQDQFPDCQAEFEELNPNIEIKFTRITYSDHLQKLKIDLASGQGPDVFSLQAGASFKEFRDFENELTDFAIGEWGDSWQDKFLPFATEMLNEDAHFFGMPMGTTYAGSIWFNKTHFDALNLSIPTSYDDLKAASEAFRANGQLPLLIGSMDDYINQDMFMNIANDVNQDKIYAAIEGNLAFTDPDVVEMFRLWQSLFTEGIFQDGAVGLGMSDATSMYEREGAATMYCNGSWGIGNFSPYREDPELQAIFLDGQYEHVVGLIDWNNDGAIAPVTATVENVLCMNSDSAHPDEAWTFIAYMLTGGQDILVNRYMQCFTSRTDSTATLEVELPADGAAAMDQIIAWGSGNVGGYREIPYPELKQTICDNLKALGMGSVTPEEAAELIETASQSTSR